MNNQGSCNRTMMTRPAFLFLVFACLLVVSRTEAPSTCSATDEDRDPALKLMSYDVGDGPQEVLVYVEPDVTSFYKGDPPATTKVTPKFKGFQGKFINMSNRKLSLYW
jgi:hypothetical protein